MLNRNAAVLLGSFVFLAMPNPTFAQLPFGQAPFGSPTVSPWLNLNRPGTNPAINYYGIIRPQATFYSGYGSLQQQLNGTQQEIATGLGTGPALLPQTGVAAGFMTQTRFFMTRSGRSTGVAGGAGLAQRPTTGQAGMSTQPTMTGTSTSGARPSYP
jgi:hypothetical protein